MSAGDVVVSGSARVLDQGGQHFFSRVPNFSSSRGDRGYLLQGLLVTVAIFLERPLLDQSLATLAR